MMSYLFDKSSNYQVFKLMIRWILSVVTGMVRMARAWWKTDGVGVAVMQSGRGTAPTGMSLCCWSGALQRGFRRAGATRCHAFCKRPGRKPASTSRPRESPWVRWISHAARVLVGLPGHLPKRVQVLRQRLRCHGPCGSFAARKMPAARCRRHASRRGGQRVSSIGQPASSEEGAPSTSPGGLADRALHLA